MKRWVSGILASTMLLLVVATGMFALVKSYVAPFNSYATPVAYANPERPSASASQPVITPQGSLVSFEPTLQFSYASWAKVDTQSKDANRATKMVNEELAKYSSDELSTFGLKKVYLVQKLYVDGTFRSGFPEARFEDALYFDIDSKYVTSENGDYMRRTIHHELRHLADYNMYKSFRPQDKDWLGCNVASATYGDGGSSMYNNVAYAHTPHPETGFITGYATSGIDEDRAEVFAYYMTDKNYLYKTAQDDASLSCKVAQTERLMNGL